MRKFIDSLKSIVEAIKNYLKNGDVNHRIAAQLAQDVEALEQYEKLWVDALKAAVKNNAKMQSNAKENTDTESSGGVKYAINEMSEDDISEEVLNRNIEIVANMAPVTILSGNEFSRTSNGIIEDVGNYFDTFNNSVYNAVLGDVTINRDTVGDDIAHGLGRKKAISFTAVPNVISKGLLIDYQKKWKSRGYDTAVLVAPITIGVDDYYMAVILRRTKQYQKFYVHEVISEKKEDIPFKTRNGINTTVNPSGNLLIFSLLQKIVDVKHNNKKSLSETDSDTKNIDTKAKSRYNINKKLLDLMEPIRISSDEYWRLSEAVSQRYKSKRVSNGQYQTIYIFNPKLGIDKSYLVRIKRRGEFDVLYASDLQNDKNVEEIINEYYAERKGNYIYTDRNDGQSRDEQGTDERHIDEYDQSEKGMYDSNVGSDEVEGYKNRRIRDNGSQIDGGSGRDIKNKFSLSEPVEEKGDLIALHNIYTDKLIKSLKLGGFPMPSIAVTKADMGHGNYGEISFVFDKSSIDPKFNKSNKVYGGDAWTPTYPDIEYKVNDKTSQIKRKSLTPIAPTRYVFRSFCFYSISFKIKCFYSFSFIMKALKFVAKVRLLKSRF